jgi:succinate dehydrogenase hydrophobic anchor subunit
MSASDNLDIHLTGLAQWMLQRIGGAILASTGVAVVAAFILAVLSDSPGPAIGFGSLAWVVVFGLYLSMSRAPMPYGVEDLD